MQGSNALNMRSCNQHVKHPNTRSYSTQLHQGRYYWPQNLNFVLHNLSFFLSSFLPSFQQVNCYGCLTKQVI